MRSFHSFIYLPWLSTLSVSLLFLSSLAISTQISLGLQTDNSIKTIGIAPILTNMQENGTSLCMNSFIDTFTLNIFLDGKWHLSKQTYGLLSLVLYSMKSFSLYFSKEFLSTWRAYKSISWSCYSCLHSLEAQWLLICSSGLDNSLQSLVFASIIPMITWTFYMYQRENGIFENNED